MTNISDKQPAILVNMEGGPLVMGLTEIRGIANGTLVVREEEKDLWLQAFAKTIKESYDS